MCSVAREHTHRQTDTHESDYWGHPFRISGVFPSTYHQGSAQYHKTDPKKVSIMHRELQIINLQQKSLFLLRCKQIKQFKKKCFFKYQYCLTYILSPLISISFNMASEHIFLQSIFVGPVNLIISLPWSDMMHLAWLRGKREIS